MEIKFTSDGKKVVVIGSLNSQEKIVQEVFIVNGSEIPSGEHFVCKSLHDAPAVSWKEQHLINLEKMYESESSRYSSELDKLRASYRSKSAELKEKYSYICKVNEKINPNIFDTLIDYITGEIKFVVVNGYYPELLDIDNFNQMTEYGLRLVSIFGRDDGTFTYAIGDYSDDSGSDTKFIPCKTYDEAVCKLKELLSSLPISEKSIEIAGKYGFEYPKDEMDKYKSGMMEDLKKSIENNERQIKLYKSRMKKLMNKTASTVASN